MTEGKNEQPTYLTPFLPQCARMSKMDTTSMFVPVILAGGSGERFWPLSRRHRPKQFLTLDDSGRSVWKWISDRLFTSSVEWKVVSATELSVQQVVGIPKPHSDLECFV